MCIRDSLTLKDDAFMQNPGSSYEEFVEKTREYLMQACQAAEQQDSQAKELRANLSNIIAAHPKLGEPKRGLSAHSLKEQRNLANADPVEIQEALKRLNKEYEQKYPGLRFVVFVNGRSRPEIIKVIEQRLVSGNSWIEEARLACNEMCDIAIDRIRKNS